MNAILAAALGAIFAQTAGAPGIEHLGQPCRARQILGTRLVTDRRDGRERLFLLNDNETYHCEIVSVDVEKDAAEVFSAPAGAGSWCGIEVPGDRFVIGTFYDGSFLIFDLRNRTFAPPVKFPGEQYIWNLALGTDGRVYGGTYPGGKLGALDLATLKVEDLGAPAKPNLYLRYVSAAPWGEIFANFSMEASTTKRYDIARKTWRDIPGLPPGQTFGVGVAWKGHFVAADPRTGRIEAFRDASLVPVNPSPWPPPPAGASLNTTLSDEKNLFIAVGHTLYRCRAGDLPVAWTKVADVDLRGGRFVGQTRDGSLLGVRGQSYVMLRPGAAEPVLRPIPGESRGRPLLFLEADPHGRLWGGPHFGQTLLYYDIDSGRSVNTDVICDAGGEVYDVTFTNSLVYAASYAGGDITCYDPAQPWDQWNRRNPRPVASVAPAYIRPTGGIRTGPDGRLYAGWQARYGTYGGAVSITDPATGKTELIENPLGSQAVASFDVDSQAVYIGTSLGGNGLPNQKAQARFGAVDLATRRTVFDRSFNAPAVSLVTREPASGLVAMAVNHRLHLYDPASKTIVADPIDGLGTISGRSILAPGDGTLIAASGPRIVRIDLGRKRFDVLAEAPADIECLARASDGRLYFTHQADLYRVAIGRRVSN